MNKRLLLTEVSPAELGATTLNPTLEGGEAILKQRHGQGLSRPAWRFSTSAHHGSRSQKPRKQGSKTPAEPEESHANWRQSAVACGNAA